MELYLSKSSTETFIQCEKKFESRYITKEEVERESNEPALFGNAVHSVLENYFASGKKLDLIEEYKKQFDEYGLKSHDFFELGHRLITDYAHDSDNGNEILSLEKDFKLYLDNGIPVKGFIDRIDKISDDEIEIIDYKTGYSQPLTRDQLEKDIQLGIYNLAALQLYPGYKKYKLTLNYLHYGKISCYRTEEQLESLKSYLAMIHARIINKVKNGEKFEASVNAYCLYCDYKGGCQKYKDFLKDTNPNTPAAEYMGLISKEAGTVVDIEVLDKFLSSVVARKKILTKIEYQAKDFIKDLISRQGQGNSIQVGNTTYKSISKKNTSYDVNQVIEMFREKGIDLNKILDARKTDIDKMLKGDKEALQALKDGAQVSYSNAYIR